MNKEDNLIRLEIFGEEYSVKSKADQSYLRNIAKYVDGHMREISENVPQSQPTLRIAVLAAMNIADELFKLRQEADEFRQTYDLKTTELANVIDEALNKHSIETTE